jgi:hypothetical protein
MAKRGGGREMRVNQKQKQQNRQEEKERCKLETYVSRISCRVVEFGV